MEIVEERKDKEERTREHRETSAAWIENREVFPIRDLDPHTNDKGVWVGSARATLDSNRFPKTAQSGNTTSAADNKIGTK